MEAPILYLFNRTSDGQWIFGENSDCEVAAGQFRLVPSEDRTTVDVYQYKLKRFLYYRVPVTNFKNESGESYASFNDLKAAYLGFAQQGSLLNPLNELIKSLNPIFWIEDMTNVVDGKLVDKSGNNTQIAVSTVNEVNDTITMPASNTAIINALIADGTYYYFYTNDTTPKAVRIGGIVNMGARRMYHNYWKSNFCLFADAPSLEIQTKLYELLSINKSFLPDVNLLYPVNFFKTSNPINPVNSTSFNSLLTQSNDTYQDNVLSFSKSKKNRLTSTVPQSVDNVIISNPFSVGGNYKLSFWVDVTDLGDRNMAAFLYMTRTGQNIGMLGGSVTYWLKNWDTQYLPYTWTISFTGGVLSGELKEKNGNYVRCEMSWFAYNTGNENKSSFATFGLTTGLSGGTPILKSIKTIDFLMTKDYSGTLASGNILTAPYQKVNSKIYNKSICIIGDSITQGGWYAKYMQNCYGISTIYNCGVSGRRIANYDANNLWQDRATVIAQPAEIFTILASANDNSSTVGTIDDTDVTTYLGGYNQYLTYLLANIPDVASKKIVLITCPFLVGNGNTIAQGKALYQQKYIDFANGVKALGVKYNLPVIDLHGLMPMTFENSGLYLTDKTHWTTAMDVAAGDIIGKGLNDLY